MSYTEILILYSVAWGLFSLMTFGFYWFDKRQAKKGGFRVRESSLLMLTLLLGSIGGLVGMYALRHKTKHIMFVVTTWAAFIIHSGILALLLVRMDG